jgi:coproporphyrinogen III oxidase
METVTIQPSAAMVAFHGYLDRLQHTLTQAVSQEDGTPFEFKDWIRPEGGGGRMAMLRDGPVVEKGACHVSKVWGSSNPLSGQPFCAAGLSLILHPRNPNCATVHMNVRRFEERTGGWWGGGMDLTPLGIRHEPDVQHFHEVLANRLGRRYPAGRAEAERYFHVPHRARNRGAGGVFYDRIDSGDVESDGAFIQTLGNAFLDAYRPLLARRNEPFTDADRDRQLTERGIYVEFNLLYDKGTRFGFQSGGNVEAILSSLPPLVRW